MWGGESPLRTFMGGAVWRDTIFKRDHRVGKNLRLNWRNQWLEMQDKLKNGEVTTTGGKANKVKHFLL